MFLLTCWVSGLISRERSYQNLSKKSGVQKKQKTTTTKQQQKQQQQALLPQNPKNLSTVKKDAYQ